MLSLMAQGMPREEVADSLPRKKILNGGMKIQKNNWRPLLESSYEKSRNESIRTHLLWPLLVLLIIQALIMAGMVLFGGVSKN